MNVVALQLEEHVTRERQKGVTPLIHRILHAVPQPFWFHSCLRSRADMAMGRNLTSPDLVILALVLKLLHFPSPNTADGATSCPSCFTVLPDTARVPFLSVASAAVAAIAPPVRSAPPTGFGPLQ